MQSWQLQEAKARLSEVVKHGKSVAVVISRETFDRLTQTQDVSGHVKMTHRHFSERVMLDSIIATAAGGTGMSFVTSTRPVPLPALCRAP